MQHMVQAAKLAGFFHHNAVAGLFHHAKQLGVAGGVLADGAIFLIGQVAANAAAAHLAPGLLNGLGQAQRILLAGLQQVHCQALAGFGANAGQFGQRFNQLLH